MKAIIEIGKSQIIVEKNQSIFIEKIEGEVGSKVSFDKVLLIGDKYGKPYLESAKVEGVIEKQSKQKKIIVLRHNHKSTHRRKYGHRQPYTRVKINSISL